MPLGWPKERRPGVVVVGESLAIGDSSGGNKGLGAASHML